MICKMKKSSANGYPPIIWWVGMIFLMITTCSCGSIPSPTAIYFTPTLPTPTIFTPTPAITPSVAPTHTSTATPSPTATRTQAPPTAKPLKDPLISTDIFSTLKPGQYLLNVNIEENRFLFISIDGKLQYETQLPVGWEESTLRFSNDHTKLLYARNILPGPVELGSLAVIDLKKQTYQSFDIDNCLNGSWSPEGDRFVTICNGDIMLVSITTGVMTSLKTYCHSECMSVQWSPDGQWLGFTKGDIMRPNESGLFILSFPCIQFPETCKENLRGPVNLHAEPFLNANSFSPDGNTLLTYEDSLNKNLVLGMVDIHTGQTVRKIEIPNMDKRQSLSLRWSPDGKWIAFDQLDGIYLVSPDGGTPKKIWNIQFPRILQWITIAWPFTPGSVYTITAAGENLNLRNQPSMASKVQKILNPGETITILEGPSRTEGYIWWRMQAKDGIEGWAADIPDWYAPQVTATPSPIP